MDLIVYALCKNLVSKAVASLGDVFSLKGNVASINELPLEGNKPGDIYLVGPNQDGSYDEYYWTTNNIWETMGSTGSGVVMDSITARTLYAGEDNTGTIEDPAEDTIMYVVNNYNRTIFLAKDNTTAYTPTANYHPATKLYVDNKINEFNLEII